MMLCYSIFIFFNLYLLFVQSDDPDTNSFNVQKLWTTTTTYRSRLLFDFSPPTYRSTRLHSSTYDYMVQIAKAKLFEEAYKEREAKRVKDCQRVGNISYIDFTIYSS